MLILTAALHQGLVDHALEQHPIEACGILTGPQGTDRPTRLIRICNILGSETAYQFDPTEQVAAFAEMDERGEDPIVIYHSHIATDAVPSGTDTKCATYPDAHYVIISTAIPDAYPVVRSWRLIAGAWQEEQIATRGDSPEPGAAG